MRLWLDGGGRGVGVGVGAAAFGRGDVLLFDRLALGGLRCTGTGQPRRAKTKRTTKTTNGVEKRRVRAGGYSEGKNTVPAVISTYTITGRFH